MGTLASVTALSFPNIVEKSHVRSFRGISPSLRDVLEYIGPSLRSG
jgi:hypothetical protein